MSRIKAKAIAICIAVLALIGTNVYTWQCYQKERAANENLIKENENLKVHVEILALKSIDLMHKLEAANDRAEALLK